MLGYPTNFIHMTCVNLLASGKYSDKRIAYVALCVLMDERSEVLLLTSHTIKKDLELQRLASLCNIKEDYADQILNSMIKVIVSIFLHHKF